MAVATTTVQGKVLIPSGGAATSGTLEIRLSAPAHTDDGGTEQLIGGKVSTSIGADGTVSFALVPNDVLTPTDTYYTVEYDVRTPTRHEWVERWTVDSSPDPVDIGDITRLVVDGDGDPTIVTITASSFSTTGLPTASADYLGVVAILDTGSGETAGYMCHRTEAGTYEWVYSGGSPASNATVVALPDAALYDVGYAVLLDTGSGETASYVVHRDSSDVKGWVQTSNGGEG